MTALAAPRAAPFAAPRATLRATPPSPVLPDHVACGDDAAVLAAILSPAINLAIWTRSPAIPLPRRRNTVADVLLTVEAADAISPLCAALVAAGHAGATAEALAADIAMLAARLAGHLDRSHVAIRLQVIETDACKRFHADHVGIRLICTYAGPGTQWLAQADAARLTAGAAIDTLPVHALAPGHVALFKGRTRAPDHPIIHRSPPIAATGQRRLVLVIDGVGGDDAPGPSCL